MKEISRLFDILNLYVEKYPNQNVALACKREKNWVTFLTRQKEDLKLLMPRRKKDYKNNSFDERKVSYEICKNN